MTAETKTFPGGYSFKRFGGQPRDEVVDIHVPMQATMLLTPTSRSAMDAVVAPGDSVRAGQIIGQDRNGVGGPVHSSVNGTVIELREQSTHGTDATVIVIESDNTSEWTAVNGHSTDWEKLSDGAIEDLLHQAGVTGLGRDGIPTRHGNAFIGPEEVEHILVRAVGTDIYNISAPVLLADDGIRHFGIGLAILKKLMPNACVHVAFSTDHESLAGEATRALAGCGPVQVHLVAPKFPQERDEILYSTLIGKPFPYGYSPAHVGVVVLDVQAVLHAWEAVTQGKPVIERIVALGGQGLSDTPHVRVRIGTPVAEAVGNLLRDDVEVRTVLGGPMLGTTVDDLSWPIDRGTSVIAALPIDRSRSFLQFMRLGSDEDSYCPTFLSRFVSTTRTAGTALKGEQRPCMSCGFCENVCPVGIIPHLLQKYVDRDMLVDDLVTYRIFNCVDCNLCTYVCPCKIPVAERIKDGKRRLREDGLDNSVNILPFFSLKGLRDERSEG